MICVQVVDTPGFFDTEISEEAVFDNAVRSLMVAHPGPHAVLFVLRAGLRFTDEEQKAYNRLKRVFGEDVVNHIIIALTYGDVLEEEGCTLDDIKNDANEKLTTVFRQCGHRCIVFNNKQPGNETRDLIREIQNLGRGPFTQGNSLLGMTQQAVESEVRRRVRASQEVELRNDPHGQRLQSENEAYERELENVRREAAAGLNKALVASVVGLAVGAVVAVFVPPNVAVALTAEAVTKPRCVVS